MPPAGRGASPAQPSHTRADPAPKTAVELIYRLLSDTGNTVRTLAVLVVPLVMLAVVIHLLKLPAGGFAGGGLLTGLVARAKKRLKKRNGSASGG